MILSVAKKPNGQPEIIEDRDIEQWHKVHSGEVLEFKVSRIRDVVQHRKYFAMIKLAFENQQHFENENRLRKWAQMKAGYYKAYPAPNGQTIYEPDSIAYSCMDEDDFTQLRARVGDVLIEFLQIKDAGIPEFTGGLDRETIDDIIRMANT